MYAVIDFIYLHLLLICRFRRFMPSLAASTSCILPLKFRKNQPQNHQRSNWFCLFFAEYVKEEQSEIADLVNEAMSCPKEPEFFGTVLTASLFGEHVKQDQLQNLGYSLFLSHALSLAPACVLMVRFSCQSISKDGSKLCSSASVLCPKFFSVYISGWGDAILFPTIQYSHDVILLLRRMRCEKKMPEWAALGVILKRYYRPPSHSRSHWFWPFLAIFTSLQNEM